jgi:hypothetical protein
MVWPDLPKGSYDALEITVTLQQWETAIRSKARAIPHLSAIYNLI